MVAYMHVADKAWPCVCGSIYACRNPSQMYSVLMYTSINRQCIIAYVQHSWPCKLDIHAVPKHCMVAYMQVAGKAWLFVCGSIYACQNSSQNVQCTHVYGFPSPVHQSINVTQLTLRTWHICDFKTLYGSIYVGGW